MLLVLLIIVLAVPVLIQWIFFLITRPRDVPPGPFPLPLIGNVWIFLRKDCCKVFRELHAKYGDAVTIYAGCSTAGMSVIIMGWDAIVEVASNAAAADRPLGVVELRGIKEGILWAQYANARQRRNFLLKSFKQFGVLTSKLTNLQDMEVTRMLEVISSNVGQPFDPETAITEAVSSCVVIALFNRRFDMNDQNCADLLAQAQIFLNSNFLRLNLMPRFVQRFFNDETAIAERKMEAIMTKWLLGEIEGRKEGNEAKDILDLYMATNLGAKLDDGFMRSMLEAFAASLHTTSETIKWALFYLAHMPDEQERLFKEIESAISSNCYPAMENRAKLPRLDAFIHESSRYASLAPTSFPRRCSKPVWFGPDKRYLLPENVLFTLAWYPCHFDEKYWLDPDNFRVDRWLHPETGEFLSTKDHLSPFGIGRRSCPGEQVAQSLVFLCVATFIQRYKWQLAEHVPFDSYRFRLARATPHHKLIFTCR